MSLGGKKQFFTEEVKITAEQKEHTSPFHLCQKHFDDSRDIFGKYSKNIYIVMESMHHIKSCKKAYTFKKKIIILTIKNDKWN